MNNEVLCKCGGTSEHCIYCGGTGVVLSEKIEIIKTVVTEIMRAKEVQDLEEYLHKNDEKLYESEHGGRGKRKQNRKKGLPNKPGTPSFGILNETKKDGIVVLDNSNRSSEEIRQTNKLRKRPVKQKLNRMEKVKKKSNKK